MNYYDLFKDHLQMEGMTIKSFCQKHDGFKEKMFYNHINQCTYVSWRYDKAIIEYLEKKKAITKSVVAKLLELNKNRDFLEIK